MKVVILGAGDVGTHLARVLSKDIEIVLIDRNPNALDAAEEELDVLTVRGDITHRRALLNAEVHKAALVIAVTGSDDANVVGAALSAELGAVRTVARVDDSSFYRTKSGTEAGVLGIHSVLCAARLIGDEMLRTIASVDADAVWNLAQNRVQMGLLTLRSSHPATGKPARSLNLEGNCTVNAVIREGKARSLADLERLEVGDRVLVAGRPLELAPSLRKLTGAIDRRGVIVGGGDVGLQLAEMLSTFEGRVQIIERDAERCDLLAERLPNVDILRGDGTAVATLRDEHIESADYLVSLTRSDEVNLMVSLIAKDLGVPSCFALVHRPGYSEIYHHLGVRDTTGPHEVFTNMVRRLLPQSGVLAKYSIARSPLSLFEILVPEIGTTTYSYEQLALPVSAVIAGHSLHIDSIQTERVVRSGDTLAIVAPDAQEKNLVDRIERLSRR